MTILHDRLAALADDAPPGGPDPDLWDRGRRYQRRRRAGTVAISAVAVLLLVAVATVGWTRTPHDVVPAEPGKQLGLPDRLYRPSPWLPGTDETGPIGPLVALVPGQRGESGGGIAGVSAAGAYAFLDLPDRAEVDDKGVAVSPDGRWVAYWLTGDTAGEPNTSLGPDPVTGVGVYDTVSGETERFDVQTEHGLMAEDLTWGGSTLWFDYLQLVEAGTAGDAQMPLDETGGLAWDLADGTQRAFTARDMPETYGGTSDQDALVTVAGRHLVTSTIDAPGTEGGPRFDVPVESTAVIDPAGGRVAIQEDTDDPEVATNQAEPLVLATPSSSGLTTARVPGERVDVLLGWRDEGHVVVQRYGEDDGSFLSLDVRTGQTEHLLEGFGTVPQDVWQAPRFDAPRPPEPMSPGSRATLVGTGLATVVLGLGALVLWRRRVRA